MSHMLMMLLLNIQTLGSCAIVTHVFSLIVWVCMAVCFISYITSANTSFLINFPHRI